MTPPNIAIIVLDTVRLFSTSLYDADSGTTPELERFACASTVYSSVRTPAPWTLPAHASLFTGLYPSEHGTNNLNPALPENAPTLASRLGDAGYATTAVSANAWVGPDFGLDRGFSRFVRGWQLFDSSADFSGKGRVEAVTRLDKVRAGVAGHSVREWPRVGANLAYSAHRSGGHFHGGRIARMALGEARIGVESGRPTFLFVNFLDAHMPYSPPAWARRAFGVSRSAARRVEQSPYKVMVGAARMDAHGFNTLCRLYLAELRALDRTIGLFLTDLRAVMGDDTLLVVTSDHGENLGEHGLLDHQFSLHDTLLRIPTLVRYPGGECAGDEVSHLAQWHDLHATVLAVAGADPVIGSSQLLPGPLSATFRQAALSEYPTVQPTPEVLASRYPGVDLSRISRTLTAVVRHDGVKAIWGSDGSVELYATADDPFEERLLADESLGSQLAELRAGFERRLRRAEPPAGPTDVDDEVRRQLEAIGYL